jgi:PIN domain nuclease of toxin-antitoxin system
MRGRYLLDTHVWLWFCLRPERLSVSVSTILVDADNDILFSSVSAWEIAIKQGLGKLTLPGPAASYVPDRLQKTQLSVLPIQLSHALAVSGLPQHHNDPFDRLLIAQASVERVPVITADRKFSNYDIDIVLN